MSKYSRYPKLVASLCQVFNGWIVGGAVDYARGLTNEKPKDFDVIIPHDQWNGACKILPADAVINSCGGFKCKSNSVSVDVWMDDVGSIARQQGCFAAYYPNTDTYLTSQQGY